MLVWIQLYSLIYVWLCLKKGDVAFSNVVCRFWPFRWRVRTHTQHKAFCLYQCLCLCVRGVRVVTPPEELVHGSGEAI